MVYEIFGLAVECDAPLPELGRVPGRAPEIVAHVGSRAARGPDWRPAHACSRDDGSRWLEFATRGRGEDWRLRFPGLADFTVTASRSRIGCAARPGVPRRTLRHLLIDHVLPIVLAARGHLLLHASGVATGAGAVLFAGPSGAGKSTLAFMLGRPPWRLLADDVVRLEVREDGARAFPAYPGSRLWPDVLRMAKPGARLPRIAHYSDKRRLRAEADTPRGGEGTTVTRVFMLREAEPDAPGIELRPRGPAAALVDLVPHVYRLDPDDGASARRQFEALTSFCSVVPARSLAFRRRLEDVDAIRDAIAHDLDVTGVQEAGSARGASADRMLK